MAHGIIVFDYAGNKILDSSKRFGRLVGWHDIDPAPTGKFKYTWDHHDLLPMGDLFVWLNPSFWFNHNGWCDCRIENGVIIFEGDLRRNDKDLSRLSYMRILYGVKS